MLHSGMVSLYRVQTVTVSLSTVVYLLLLVVLIMGTAIFLSSHDCLQNHDASSSAKSQTNPNPKRTRRKKRSSERRRGEDDSSAVVKLPSANLVMGEVKILKRGEKLSNDDVAKKKSEPCFDLVLGSTDRLGPEPETVKDHVRVPDLTDGIYAGPSALASPPPSSVPVPGFLGRINGGDLRQLRRVIS